MVEKCNNCGTMCKVLDAVKHSERVTELKLYCPKCNVTFGRQSIHWEGRMKLGDFLERLKDGDLP